MAIADAIRAGFQVGSYIREAPQRAEEAKLKSQLFKAQAEHETAQAQLIQNEMARRSAAMQDAEQIYGGAQLPQLGSDLPPIYQRAPRQTPLTQPAPLAPQPGPVLSSGGQVRQPIEEGQSPLLQTPEELLDSQYVRSLFRRGFIKEANDKAQVLVNAANSRRLLQDQRTQQEVGKVEEERQFLQNHGLLTPQRDQQLRSREIALLHAGGKTSDAIRLSQGDISVVQSGGTVVRTRPGGAEAVFQSPVSPEALAQQRARGTEQGRQDILGTPRTQARERRTGTLEAELGESGAAQPTANEVSQLTQQLIAAGMDPQQAAEVAPTVLRAMTPTAAPTAAPSSPPTQGPAARVSGQRAAAAREQTAIPRETAEQIGVPIGTTYGDLESGRVQAESPIPRQMPTASEREDLSKMEVTISSAQKLLADMKAHPEYTGLLGNFLTDPQGALKRALARRGGNATKEERKFLAQLGVTTATLRSQLIGLSQTQRELSGLVDFLPGPETSAEQIEAALEAIVEHVTLQRDKLTQTQRSLGVQTPGGRQGQAPQPQRQTPAVSPSAAPPKTDKELVEEELRKRGRIK